jgi:hypothetical protein
MGGRITAISYMSWGIALTQARVMPNRGGGLLPPGYIAAPFCERFALERQPGQAGASSLATGSAFSQGNLGNGRFKA